MDGVPQGSVLDPLLFLVYIADLKNVIKSSFAMYAGDIKLYNISSNSMILKEYLGDILKWSRDWLFPLNKDKCNFIYLGSKNLRPPIILLVKYSINRIVLKI